MAAQMIAMDPAKRGDMYYRYKMPAFVTKVEGSGNGIKTVFPNIHDVCIAINRPETVLIRFFQFELGALRNVSAKDDKFVIMGSHTEERMQEKVYEFITKFVLCKHCRNPETQVVVGSSDKVSLLCGACGKSSLVPLTDRTTGVLATHYKAEKASKKAAPAQKAPAAKKADEPASPASPTQPEVTTTISRSDLVDDRRDPMEVLAEQLLAKPDSLEDQIRTVYEQRLLCNIEEQNLVRLVFRGIVKTNPNNYISAIRTHGKLLKRFARVQGLLSHGATFTEAELETMQATEKKLQGLLMSECELQANSTKKAEKMPIACFVLYQEGALKESSVQDWLTARPSSKINPELAVEMRNKTKPLVKWLGGTVPGQA